MSGPGQYNVMGWRAILYNVLGAVQCNMLRLCKFQPIKYSMTQHAMIAPYSALCFLFCQNIADNPNWQMAKLDNFYKIGMTTGFFMTERYTFFQLLSRCTIDGWVQGQIKNIMRLVLRILLRLFIKKK